MTDSTRLAADTSMGPVTLDVADVDRVTAYYRDAVGLSELDDPWGTVLRLTPGGRVTAQRRVDRAA